MTTVTESVKFSNLGISTTAAFKLKGGKYAIVASAAATATIDLLTLAADGVTFVKVITTITTSGFANADLPPGQYQVVIAVAGSAYVSITSVPY